MLVAALGTRPSGPILSDDPIGAEIGGAVKNVLAIACGIVEGRGLGDNARAALITRGLAEMIRLGVALGGQAGDADGPVRPRRPGADLHRHAVAQLLARHRARPGPQPGRGAGRTPLGRRRRRVRRRRGRLAGRLGVDMPIVSAVDAVLHRGAAIDSAVAGLLARPFRRRGIGAIGRLDGSPQTGISFVTGLVPVDRLGCLGRFSAEGFHGS